MTPIELHYALQESNKKEEVDMQLQYEVARYLAKHIWNAQGRLLKQLLKKPQDVELFPWEIKNKKVKQQSVEEMKHVFKSIVSHFDKKVDKENKIKNQQPKINKK